MGQGRGWRGHVVSGGYTSGYTMETSEDENVTGESYREALQDYVASTEATP